MLDDLERLERAATPGPWEAKRDYSKDWLIAGQGKILVDSMDAGPHGERDIRLIAAARNALPALLAVARAADSGEWHSSEDCEVEGRAAECGLCRALAALEGHGDA